MLESAPVAIKWHDRAMRWLRRVDARAQDSAAAQHGGMGRGPQGATNCHRATSPGEDSWFSEMQCAL